MINYNQADGLTSSYIYNLRQDERGFIWIGSSNGLFRFDGISFKQYGKKDGLKNVDILACETVSKDEIFIIPFLDDFAYLKGNKVINSDMNSELKKIKFGAEAPNFISDKKRGEIIIHIYTNPKNIYIYKKGKVKVIPIIIDPAKYGRVYAFDYKTDAHLLYLKDSKNRIIAYDIITRKIKVCNLIFGSEEVVTSVKDNLFTTINNKKNVVSVYLMENYYSFRKIQHYQSPENIYSSVIDNNKKLWIGLENGGALYFDQSLYTPYSLSKPVKFLEDYVINYILADHDNNLWFATRNNGLFFIGSAPFRSYITLPLKNNSSYITSISSNSKNIFLGYNTTGGGIYNSGKLTNLTFSENKKNENKAVTANEKFVYFAQTNNVFEYNLLTKKQRLINFKGTIKNLIPYGKDTILVCTSQKLFLYHINSGSYTELWDHRTYMALPYDKDSLLVGTFKDLYKFNIKTKKAKLFLEGYYFTDIKKLKDNLYAGSTNTSGIILFNKKNIVCKIDESNGLSNNQVKKIMIESENIFWASTESGLIRVQLTGNKPIINKFTITDGLPSDNVAGVVIKGDSIFVGTSGGLGIFSIKHLLTQQKYINKKVIVNSVVTDGKEYFGSYDRLHSQTPKNNITFNLSFLDYASQGKIGYKYKLEGLNTSWETTNSSKIIFSSLPPKKYIFKVYGLGYNGKQSVIYTQIPFEIKPRFWETVWFRVLVAILVLIIWAIIMGLYSQRSRNKKLKNILTEKRMAELELQAIKAQINPHFIYNCLNSIKFLLYKKENADAESYLKTFSQMIRKTLHYSEKTFMPIKEEVEYLTLYLDMEKLRLKDQFDYKITVSDDLNPEWLIPSLLIQPFVENAIKHGIPALEDRKGYITIDFAYSGTDLCVVIEDNGTGIKDKTVLTKNIDSFGVKLSQKRIHTFKQLFNTKITLEITDLSETKQKPGTQIKLFISQNENKNTGMHH
ncbi:hypothetical protein HNP38_003141 [Chryseobacterium defluvii]|uniref:Two component regulator with propeller domain n=1 Tax=Chryseobacterium defluvii TaxID=160396 RepID=A0A840KGM5_9FLAO|nr:histidine kinase [Chryseobacterium defluvii]MBB4807825.1 hypothetical protein [Chryseobacterium defluvii]